VRGLAEGPIGTEMRRVELLPQIPRGIVQARHDGIKDNGDTTISWTGGYPDPDDQRHSLCKTDPKAPELVKG
jgi:hypothetical protein